MSETNSIFDNASPAPEEQEQRQLHYVERLANQQSIESLEREKNHAEQQRRVAEQHVQKARDMAANGPMSKAQWENVAKTDAVFYHSETGKALRAGHQRALGMLYFSDH